MTFIVVVTCMAYALLLLCLAMPALNYKPHHEALKKNMSKSPMTFTIIITYRNEAAALPRLLESISLIDYPANLTQWIFVNDASDDASVSIVTEFKNRNKHQNILLLDREPKSNSAKKDAISQAIASADYKHIITTDADCELPAKWLHTYNNHYQQYAEAHFIAAPVVIEYSNLNEKLQSSEMLSLQAISIGAFSYRQPFLCNGANMSFKKRAFKEVAGYKGNLDISSGDDIFLLEKLAAEDVIQCHYLKDHDAIVNTLPKKSWSEMIQQRVRWAKKGSNTKSLLNKLVSLQVLAMSLLWITAPLLYVINVLSLDLWLIVWAIKFFTDAIVLFIATTTLQQSRLDWTFIINHLRYPFVVLIIAFKTLTGTVTWSKRTINQ